MAAIFFVIQVPFSMFCRDVQSSVWFNESQSCQLHNPLKQRTRSDLLQDKLCADAENPRRTAAFVRQTGVDIWADDDVDDDEEEEDWIH